LVMVKVGTGGKFSVYNAVGSVDVVADVVGWFTDGTTKTPGGSYNPLVPARILDTRNTAKVGPDKTIDVQATGQGLVPATGVSAVVINVTATHATAGDFLTVFPTGTAKPLASNLNFGP